MKTPAMRSSNRFRNPVIWLVLSLPALIVLYRFSTDSLSYGQVIHQTGIWSVAFLMVVMAITPLRHLFGPARWVQILLRQRRALGVASFGYAALHTGVYLERKWGADLILKEALEATLATGWVALLVFALLAATSNDGSVRRLKRRWKVLHRWVYPGGGADLRALVAGQFRPDDGLPGWRGSAGYSGAAIKAALTLARQAGGGLPVIVGA